MIKPETTLSTKASKTEEITLQQITLCTKAGTNSNWKCDVPQAFRLCLRNPALKFIRNSFPPGETCCFRAFYHQEHFYKHTNERKWKYKTCLLSEATSATSRWLTQLTHRGRSTCTSWQVAELFCTRGMALGRELWAVRTRTGCCRYRRCTIRNGWTVSAVSLTAFDTWQFDCCFPYCCFRGATNLTPIYIPTCLQTKHSKKQNKTGRTSLKLTSARGYHGNVWTNLQY